MAALLSMGKTVQTEHRRLKERNRTTERGALKWSTDEALRLQQAAKGWDKYHNYPVCESWAPDGPDDVLENHPDIERFEE